MSCQMFKLAYASGALKQAIVFPLGAYSLVRETAQKIYISNTVRTKTPV